MKKKMLLIPLALLLIASLVACAAPAPAPAPAPPAPAPAPAVAPAGIEPVTLKVDLHPNPKDPMAYVLDNGKPFEYLVEKYSDGLLHLDVTMGLYPSTESIWAVADGRTDMCISAIYAVSADVPLWSIGQLPFISEGLSDYFYATVLNPEFMEIWVPTFAEKNIIWLGQSLVTMQYVWTKTPLAKVDDFKGLKVRTSGLMQTKTLDMLGAKGTTISWEEVLPALQRGIVDAGVTGVHGGWGAGWWKVTDHLNTWPVTPQCQMGILVNKDLWENLDPFQQNALRKATEEAMLIDWGASLTQQIESFYALEDLGVTIVRPSHSEMEKARDIVMPVYDDWMKEAGPNAKPLLDALNKGLEDASQLLTP